MLTCSRIAETGLQGGDYVSLARAERLVTCLSPFRSYSACGKQVANSSIDLRRAGAVSW